LGVSDVVVDRKGVVDEDCADNKLGRGDWDGVVVVSNRADGATEAGGGVSTGDLVERGVDVELAAVEVVDDEGCEFCVCDGVTGVDDDELGTRGAVSGESCELAAAGVLVCGDMVTGAAVCGMASVAGCVGFSAGGGTLGNEGNAVAGSVAVIGCGRAGGSALAGESGDRARGELWQACTCGGGIPTAPGSMCTGPGRGWSAVAIWLAGAVCSVRDATMCASCAVATALFTAMSAL
jgi:hypothetical protein